MSDLTQRRGGVAPPVLRAARVIMYCQAVASAFIAAMQLLDVLQRVQHDQQVAGLAYFASVADPVEAVLVLVCAFLLGSGWVWVRPFAVILEVIAILGALVNVPSGYFPAVVAILLAISVMVLLFRPEVDDWIAARNVAEK